jgi:RNA recognition motif-containing protein
MYGRRSWRSFGGYDGTGMSLGALERSRCKTAWMSPIPEKTTRQQILEWFSDYSACDCNICEKNGNRFAFVEFPNEQLRDSAIAAKRGGMFRGVSVVVNRSFNAFEGPRLGGRERVDDDIFGMDFDGPRIVKY